jgi:hypothetical protein
MIVWLVVYRLISACVLVILGYKVEGRALLWTARFSSNGNVLYNRSDIQSRVLNIKRYVMLMPK